MSQDQYQPHFTNDPVHLLEEAATELVMTAARMGYTLTIETAPKKPLAVGNSVSRINVRISHAHYRHLEANPSPNTERVIVGTVAKKIILPN